MRSMRSRDLVGLFSPATGLVETVIYVNAEPGVKHKASHHRSCDLLRVVVIFRTVTMTSWKRMNIQVMRFLKF